MTSSENRFELLQDILKRTEDLLTIAGGRPLLQALHFGGVTRLSRRISHFLRHGAIHCERDGQESCVKFLTSRYSESTKHLLRQSYQCNDEVIEWITERIIESNLHRALSVIVEDSEVIQAYYDKHACLRQKDYVHDLLENVRFLDEQDQEGLHSFLLFRKNHERSPTLNNVEENSQEIDYSAATKNGNRIEKNSDLSSSLPDLTDTGQAQSSKDEKLPDPSIPRYMCKLAKKGHKRSVSDTAFLIQKDLYQVVEPQNLTKILEEDQKVPNQYPAPDSEDQSWFDYIWSGKFNSQQTSLERDNAHILLAETLIYCKHQPRKSPVKINHAYPAPESDIKVSSAEHMLLTLLFKFENPHALKAYEALELLKDRGDPLAQGLSFDGDTKNSVQCQIKTSTWIPPENKLILKIPQKPKNFRTGIETQNWLCYTCGNKVNPKYISTFRYCNYFGKYCCTTCHQNEQHVLPANIIYRWDFKEFKISTHALQILTQISDKSVINIYEENPVLLKKVTSLRQALTLREKSILTSPYIRTCRFAENLKSDLDDMLKLEKPEVFSLNDFCSIRLGIYLKRLKKQLEVAVKHIVESDCPLCLAKGFYCEKCRKSDLIFPFQNGVYQCPNCFACFHEKCFRKPCGKCLRQKLRDNLIIDNVNFPELS